MDIVAILILAGAAWMVGALIVCLAVARAAQGHSPRKDSAGPRFLDQW